MSEPDAVRAAGGGRKARFAMPHPAPGMRSTPWNVNVHGELPRAVLELVKAVGDGRWGIVIQYSRGTSWVSETRSGKLTECCLIRLYRGPVRAWGAWWKAVGSEGSWKFEAAQLSIPTCHLFPFDLKAAELKALIEMRETVDPGEPMAGIEDYLDREAKRRKVEAEEKARGIAERKAARVERLQNRAGLM